MILLHAGVFENNFLLWGETPETPEVRLAGSSRRKRTSQTNAALAKPLCYDAGIERLKQVLQEIGFDFKISKKSIEPITAWLPTADGHPIPSSPLIGEVPESAVAPVLAPWSVTALRLPVERVVELLCRCAGKQVLVPGVIVGKDLSCWAMALRFAGTLVAKQQFLPDVTERDGKYFAIWKPVLLGADNERLSRLARTMPAVARALTLELSLPPSTHPLSLLSGFINSMVDHLVRSSAGAEAIPPLRHRLTKDSAPCDNIHDHWLHALCSSDGVMEGDEAKLLQLATHVKEWARPISVSTIAPFRLCFRIEEPAQPPEQDRWYVRYLLQANHDPSLLISAEDIWRRKNLRGITDENFDPHESLLLSLGQASGICPRIETSLRTSKPAGYELDATGAYEFLSQKALMLEQSGFGVMLPAWWTGKGTKLRLTTRASVKTPEMQSVSGLSLDKIVQFDWELALGDETLSFEELQRLARLKAPLIKVRGQWVEIHAEEIQKALQFWKKKATDQATLREVIRMALGGGRTPGNIPIEGISASGWIADLLKGLEGRTPFRELSPPEGFNGTLRPYQVRGYSWLAFLRQWGLGACLADDMGLGKTIQTLVLIQ